ncbi:MAG TPA: NAD(P)H-binding protein [Candidatus Dormibacteraeota bacterium]
MTRVAITGASGFVGSHTARAVLANGDDVVLIARHPDIMATPSGGHATWVAADIGDERALTRAFTMCDAVIHCAGINLERGVQTYAAVHVQGTAAVVRAAQAAHVPRIALVSFLRARPACGSAYHESKWAAEELVRRSGLTYTILKAGVICGEGDHLLSHLSKSLSSLHVFLLVGFGSHRTLRPVAVADVARILVASTHDTRLDSVTVPVLGPEELTLAQVVECVGTEVGRAPRCIPAPIALHRALAWAAEHLMVVPLVSAAQVRILAEGVVEPVLAPDTLPEDLTPATPFSPASIRAALPATRGFTRHDLRAFRHPA